MNIANVRLGLATNSSSTHSLIFLPGQKDHLVDGASCFGWENFVCASAQAKRDYLAAAIWENLRRHAGESVALTVARAWSDGGRVTKDSFIDHESHLTLPREWDGRGLDREFVEEFKAFLLKEELVLIGGNDNDDEPHPLLAQGKEVGIGKGRGPHAMPIEDYAPWVARKHRGGPVSHAAPPSPHYQEYLRLVRELHLLMVAGQGDSEEADRVRDASEVPWRSLSSEEQEMAQRFSESLYSQENAR